MTRKLGLAGLTALVFSMMVGAGIFNIPQNLASGAGLGSVLVGWVVTAAGMLSLVFTFKRLSKVRPGLDAGIYQYAEAGFGKYMGFNMAWGYWLCVCFANVAYAVMLSDCFGAFIPSLLDHGWQMVSMGSALIWFMFLLVSHGMKTAKVVNAVMTIMKIIPIAVIVVLLYIYSRFTTISAHWPGFENMTVMWHQVRSTMMVTLWCFIGIEGAVMMSARARRSKDVGRAGVLGFLSAWVLYLLVSVFSFGVMSREELASLHDPSSAYMLRACCGEWAYWFVIISVIISVLGSWVSWTLVCAQVPMEAALVHIFPKHFTSLNRHQMPAYGLAVSSVVMNIFLVLVAMADDVYMAALSVTGMMILPCYLFSALYLCKISRDVRSVVLAVACTLFCLWMLYAAGTALIATSVFYVAGTGFYIRARYEDCDHRRKGGRLSLLRVIFTRREFSIFIMLSILALFSFVAFAAGYM